MLSRKHVKDKAKVEAARMALNRGKQWLAKNFTVKSNPPPTTARVNLWHFYYLHNLERAGHLLGEATFGDHDWRQEGIRILLRSQDKESGAWKGSGHAEEDPVIATSLALLFLAPETQDRLFPGDK
jgi:hypothetical protein